MLISRVYKSYKYRIYPYISNFRGSTRILFTLRKLVENNIEAIESCSPPIREEEWDNLIILDGCRHDLYEEVKGSTPYRISQGSTSAEFIEENFSKHDFSDTVLITGNPHCHKSKFKNLTGKDPENVFYEVFHTYNTDWNEEKGTVLPEPLIRDTETAEKLFPEKRKIIWFMQPHHPFVNSDLDNSMIFTADPDESDIKKIWSKAERKEVSKDAISDAYRSNLEFVMSSIKNLDDLEGRTVITSDHGNLVGESGLFGHPANSKSEPLRKVPWDVVSES